VIDRRTDGTSGEAPWYAQWFDRSEYETVYAARNDAEAAAMIHRIVETTALPDGASVLDMACGRGRHARAFARLGYEVTGIDLSPRAIETARRIARQEQLDIDFREGDMRMAPCTECFDMVVNLFTSFGYFDDDADHLKSIDAMAEALTDGGWLVQDFMNVDQVVSDLVPVDERREGALRVVQRRWIEGPRLVKEITLRQAGSPDQVFQESVRLLRLSDFEEMYDAAGLEIKHVLGDVDGASYTAASPRMIMFAQTK
jgi:SAM-dependent methyltransferase